jgi:preprotein translocase subunit SecG
MYGFLLALLIVDGLFLAVIVLLQSGKGGGLAAMGGGAAATEGILGGRQATTVLTRGTWTTGAIFMVLALVLSIMSSRAQQPESILRGNLAPPTTQPEPVLPGLPEETVPPTAGGADAADPGDPGGGDAGAPDAGPTGN